MFSICFLFHSDGHWHRDGKGESRRHELLFDVEVLRSCWRLSSRRNEGLYRDGFCIELEPFDIEDKGCSEFRF